MILVEMGWFHLVLSALHRHFYTIIIFVVVIICLFLGTYLFRFLKLSNVMLKFSGTFLLRDKTALSAM